MRIVLDTNVLVSALINPRGLPGGVLALVLNGKHKPLYDSRMLWEYSAVLKRPEFAFPDEAVDALLEYVKKDGEFILAEPQNLFFRDETDKKFYEVFKSGQAEFLVTGNIKHFPRAKNIVLPREFSRITNTEQVL